MTVKSCLADKMADHLGQPHLVELIRRFLWDQAYPDLEITSANIPLDECPDFNGSVSQIKTARAIFHAPSETCGESGMHSEMIRSTSSWRNSYARYDTVLIQDGAHGEGRMNGMVVGRVKAFLRFTHNNVQYPTALVEWFVPVSDACDPITGMWIVKPELHRGQPNIGLVHVDCIVRACHLIGVYGRQRLPPEFHFSYSLDAFKLYYVNHYIDYHAHEIIP